MKRKITGQDGDDGGELIKSTFLPQYEDFSNIGAVKSSELLVDVDLKIQSRGKSTNKSIFVLLTLETGLKSTNKPDSVLLMLETGL